MTLALSTTARAAMLNGFETGMAAGGGQATLTVYQTNTALCVFNLGASGSGTPFGAAVADSMALSTTLSAPVSDTGTSVAGTANRFIIRDQDLVTALTGTISAIGGGGDIEVPSLTITALSTSQRLNQLVLRLAADGSIRVEGSFTFR